MCRTLTPEADRVPCSRCGESANPTDGWEHGWPLFGRIHLGFPAQIFAPLCGDKNIAGDHAFRVFREGHPAIIDFGAQAVCFEWGNGWEYDSTGRFRLCYDCQKTLLSVIGEFFGMHAEAERGALEGTRGAASSGGEG